MTRPDLLNSTVFRRTLGLVLLMAVVAAAVIGLVGWQANRILTRAAEAAIEADAAEFKAELLARGFEGLALAVADRSRGRGAGVFFLSDAGGVKRAGNLAALPSEFLGGNRRGLFRISPVEFGTPTGSARLAAGVLIDIDGRALLVVGRDIEEQRTLLVAIYESIGLGAGLLAALGLVGGLFLSRHVLSRVGAMSRASAAIMAGNLAGRIPTDGSGDELDRLSRHLNEMLDRIESLMGGLREVSDNIAHDLKTPLNRLRNRAEAALSDASAPEAWRDGLEQVIAQADEIIKTFNALLLIARLESGSLAESFEFVDVAAIARDVAELYEPVADESGFALRCLAAEPLLVRADRQLIGQALANLIDNAFKYAREASSSGAVPRDIELSARRDGARAVLVVADRGPGIRPEQREHALKRFGRLEQSRSLPGTGLGLSLVAAVARLHGGRVLLEDNAPGLRVVIELPLASDAAFVAGSGDLEPHLPSPKENAGS